MSNSLTSRTSSRVASKAPQRREAGQWGDQPREGSLHQIVDRQLLSSTRTVVSELQKSEKAMRRLQQAPATDIRTSLYRAITYGRMSYAESSLQNARYQYMKAPNIKNGVKLLAQYLALQDLKDIYALTNGIAGDYRFAMGVPLQDIILQVQKWATHVLATTNDTAAFNVNTVMNLFSGQRSARLFNGWHQCDVRGCQKNFPFRGYLEIHRRLHGKKNVWVSNCL